MAERLHVAVVGAGVAGLLATKQCLEEGMVPTCYEQDNQIGGVWFYTKEKRPNQGAPSFESLITNTSKETMAFSDFPFKNTYPQYMRHSQYLHYLQEYARNFNLYEHIHFDTQVLKVKPSHDYDATGKWEVHLATSNGQKSQVFDRVILCSGALRRPMFPNCKGLEDFKGSKIHMDDFRTPDIYRGKRVLVLGNSNSSGDVSTDIARVASQVYLSVGKGAVFFTRHGSKGVPHDLTMTRLLSKLVPASLVSKALDRAANETLDHDEYKLNVRKRNVMTDGTIAVSEEIPYMVHTGRVIIKQLLKEFTETGAIFTDGTELSDIDAVVFATGYAPDYSYVECKDIQGDWHKDNDLYKWVFPVHQPHPTLAVVAGVQIRGVHCQAVELQARCAAAVMAGKVRLPSVETMVEDIHQKRKFYNEVCDGRMSNWAGPFAEELAAVLGVTPSFWPLFFKNPLVAIKVYLSPLLGVHYRLLGHGSSAQAWQQASDAYHRIQIVRKTTNTWIKITLFVTCFLILALLHILDLL